MSAHQPPIPFEPAKLRPRHDGWTAEKQILFIEALAASKCVDEACRRVGMSDTSAHALRRLKHPSHSRKMRSLPDQWCG